MAYPSEYLQYLPAVLQSDPTIDAVLRSFQRVLTGLPPGTASDGAPPGIEQRLDAIHTYFLPGPTLSPDQCAPDEFLPWLAGWVATSLREDWDSQTRRCFIQKVARLYPRRGTPDCLRELLTFFLGTISPPRSSKRMKRARTASPSACVYHAGSAGAHAPRAHRAGDHRSRKSLPTPTTSSSSSPLPCRSSICPRPADFFVGVNTMLGIAKLR